LKTAYSGSGNYSLLTRSSGRLYGSGITGLRGAAPTSCGFGRQTDKHGFYHTWYLTPQGDVCLVVTDEVGKGRDAAQLRETDETLMHRGHDLSLATLKWVSEGNSKRD
jgi:hypothetical protein